MENALYKYLERNGKQRYGAEVVDVAKKSGLTENSIRNIARYGAKDIERMRYGSYKKLLNIGINMDPVEETIN